jgi:hypothetical protein
MAVIAPLSTQKAPRSSHGFLTVLCCRESEAAKPPALAFPSRVGQSQRQRVRLSASGPRVVRTAPLLPPRPSNFILPK